MRRVELGLASICDAAFAFNFGAWAALKNEGFYDRGHREHRGEERRERGETISW
jgi:hypothetical protein